jgi:hypothetical protein
LLLELQTNIYRGTPSLFSGICLCATGGCLYHHGSVHTKVTTHTHTHTPETALLLHTMIYKHVVVLLHVSTLFRPSSGRYSKKEYAYVCVYYATPVQPSERHVMMNVNKDYISKYSDNSAIRRHKVRNLR